MAEDNLAVVGVEKRLSLWERMRQAILSNARGEIQSQSELEDLIRQADKDRLLKADEQQTLLRTLAEAREDHEKARAFLLRRVESEGEYELQRLDLAHRFGLSRGRLLPEVAAARQDGAEEARAQASARALDLRG